MVHVDVGMAASVGGRRKEGGWSAMGRGAGTARRQLDSSHGTLDADGSNAQPAPHIVLTLLTEQKYDVVEWKEGCIDVRRKESAGGG